MSYVSHGGEAVLLQVAPALEPLNGTETILLVEDEGFVREVASEVLKSAGYNVLAAKSAIEASHVYDQHGSSVNLLLTDVILPGENGRALASRLKRQNPALLVLLITGYAKQMVTSQRQPECLSKPFSASVILRKVRQLLDGQERDPSKETQIRPACDTVWPA